MKPDQEQAVLDAAQDRAAALAAGDAERLRGVLHAHFQWTTHTGETFDRAAYIRRNTDGSTIWRSQVLSDTHVVVVDQTAVLYASVTDVVLSDRGEPRTFEMPMTQVWVREDGAWRCLAGHAGPRRE